MLWEENESMKLSTKSKKLVVDGDENITNETKPKSKASAWIVIGDQKVWPRTCKHCGNVVYHKSISSFYISAKHNKRCEKCRQPSGKHNSFYGRSFSDKQRRKWSRDRSGSGNPMFGTKSGMFGKKHSEKTKQRQSVARKRFWKIRGHKHLKGFDKYRYDVDILTSKQPIHTLPNFEKRGKAGVDGAYHLDHVISVWYGYHNKVPKSVIADISNLRFIPWLENQKKWYH